MFRADWGWGQSRVGRACSWVLDCEKVPFYLLVGEWESDSFALALQKTLDLRTKFGVRERSCRFDDRDGIARSGTFARPILAEGRV